MARRFAWRRSTALKLLEKSGVDEPAKLYARLRQRWAKRKDLPAELRVHLVCTAVALELIEDLVSLAIGATVSGTRKSNRTSCLVTCLTSLHNDLAAIITLCENGLDVQARSLLRMYIEKIDLFTCLYFDHALCDEYIADSTFEGFRAFFYKYISGGKLKKKAKHLASAADPSSAEFLDWFYDDWRVETDLMRGAAVHPNHTVSFISLFPNIYSGRPRAIGLGGHPNNGSLVTLYKATLGIFPIALQYLDAQRLQADFGIEDDGYPQKLRAEFRQVDKLAMFTYLVPVVESMMHDHINSPKPVPQTSNDV